VTTWLVHHCRRHYTAKTVLACTLIMAVLFGVVAIGQTLTLKQRVREACAQTEAAAKLDLSSFVPLCLEVKQ
jgi:hypothetical protein